ncbi:HECT ubiquitin protein ligase family protein KAK [Perilla frutescens var. frutescens]|nr:HECT ubiquitin protein ligase family protein KAK [Perilla frutescens var. frutescens]
MPKSSTKIRRRFSSSLASLSTPPPPPSSSSNSSASASSQAATSPTTIENFTVFGKGPSPKASKLSYNYALTDLNGNSVVRFVQSTDSTIERVAAALISSSQSGGGQASLSSSTYTIFEIVNLANELLPPLPQRTISLRVSSSFFMKGSLPKKGSSSETIQSLNNITNISSFLAGVLAWKYPQVLLAGVPNLEFFIASLLNDLNPHIFRKGRYALAMNMCHMVFWRWERKISLSGKKSFFPSNAVPMHRCQLECGSDGDMG